MFLKYVDKKKFINVGFIINWKHLILGIVLGALIILFGFTILFYLKELNIVTVNYKIDEVIKVSIMFVFISFIEEAIFRGYILRNLTISFNKYKALLISSFLFALIHGLNPSITLFNFFNLFIAGLFLGVSYIYTKNLWFPIGLHLSWNLTQALLGFNVSGQKTYSILKLKIIEGNLLNGGDFGFEGSFLSTLLQVICISIIFIYYNHLKKTLP